MIPAFKKFYTVLFIILCGRFCKWVSDHDSLRSSADPAKRHPAVSLFLLARRPQMEGSFFKSEKCFRGLTCVERVSVGACAAEAKGAPQGRVCTC